MTRSKARRRNSRSNRTAADSTDIDDNDDDGEDDVQQTPLLLPTSIDFFGAAANSLVAANSLAAAVLTPPSFIAPGALMPAFTAISAAAVANASDADMTLAQFAQRMF